MKKPEFFVLDKKYQHLSIPFSNGYAEWKNSPCTNGHKKYVWFEHHSEIEFGIKCTVDYHSRFISNIEIVDEGKMLWFVLKFS